MHARILPGGGLGGIRLAGFTAQERKELPDLVERSADAVELVLLEGLAAAQNSVHTA